MRFLSLIALVAVASRADIPPRDTRGCAEKKVGEACQTDDRQAGQCATSKCVGRDYSQGMPPRPKEYECLRCASAAADVVDAGAVASPAPGVAPPLPAPAPAKKSGCNSAPMELAPLGLLLLAFRRRA